MIFPVWQYNEMQQVGTDYADEAEVETYDRRMQRLRDVNEETETIIKSINLKKDDTILEIGTGTGSFAIEAAKHCSKVIAIDVSPKMLEFAQRKAQTMGITNVEFNPHNLRCTISLISGKLSHFAAYSKCSKSEENST